MLSPAIYIRVNITFARLIFGSVCWVDYLANKGCRTSLRVKLSRDRIRFHVNSVRTDVNIRLFKRNPYMFLMTSRYSESLFIGTFVYGRSIRITHRNAEIRSCPWHGYLCWL